MLDNTLDTLLLFHSEERSSTCQRDKTSHANGDLHRQLFYTSLCGNNTRQEKISVLLEIS